MQPSTLDKFDRLAKAARRLTIVYALCCSAALLLAVAIVVGIVDWALRSDALGVRWLAVGTVVTAIIAGAVYWIVPSFRYRPSATDIAQGLERRRPELGDWISSGVEFDRLSTTRSPAASVSVQGMSATQDSAFYAGSAVLRSHAIEIARQMAEPIVRRDVLSLRRPLAAAATLSFTVVLLIALTLWDSLTVAHAARRMFMPWADLPWPTRNQLVWESLPPVVARGSDATLQLQDIGPEPVEYAIVQWRFADDRQVYEARIRKADDDSFQHVLREVHQPFYVRALAGDYRSTWTFTGVVDLPEITYLNLRVIPPEYSGQPPVDLSRPQAVWRGSQVLVTAHLDQDVAAGRLLWRSASQQHAMELTVSSDRRQLSLLPQSPWQIDQSGEFWFEIATDTQPLTPLGQRWQLPAVVDQPPDARLVLDESSRALTPLSTAIVSIWLSDDLQLSTADLFVESDSFDQDVQFSIDLGAPASRRSLPGAEPHEHTEVRQVRLAQLPGELTPGQTLVWWLEVQDRKGNTTRTPVQTSSIVSPGHKEAELMALVERAVSQLIDARQQLQRSQDAARQVRDRLQAADQRIEGLLSQLAVGEAAWTRAAQALLADPEGARQVLRQAQQAFHQHGLSDAPWARSVTEALELLNQISPADRSRVDDSWRGVRGTLHRADAHDTAIRRTATAAIDSGTTAMLEIDALVAAAIELFQPLHESQQLLTGMRQMLQQQQAVARQTQEIAAVTLGRRWDELDAQQRQRLRQLARAQAQLGHQLDQLAATSAASPPTDGDTDPAANIRELLDNGATAAEMHSAADDLDANQVAAATGRQQRIIQQLSDALDLDSTRLARDQHRPPELDPPDLRVDDAEVRDQWLRQLAELAQRQRQINRVVDQLPEMPENAARPPDIDETQWQLAVDRWQQAARQQRELNSALEELFADGGERLPTVAIDSMMAPLHRAADGLDHLAPLWSVQFEQRTGLRALLRLLATLTHAAQPEPAEVPPGETDDQTPTDPQDWEPLLVIYAVQLELHQRTVEIDEAIAADATRQAQLRTAMEQLGRHQQELTEALAALLEPSPETPPPAAPELPPIPDF